MITLINLEKTSKILKLLGQESGLIPSLPLCKNGDAFFADAFKLFLHFRVRIAGFDVHQTISKEKFRDAEKLLDDCCSLLIEFLHARNGDD